LPGEGLFHLARRLPIGLFAKARQRDVRGLGPKIQRWEGLQDFIAQELLEPGDVLTSFPKVGADQPRPPATIEDPRLAQREARSGGTGCSIEHCQTLVHIAVGNITPTAEFNIYVDPQAADIVFKSGAPITVVPLDVTHKALVTKPRNDAFRAIGTPVATAVAQMTDFFERFDREKYASPGAPLHDPCVTAYLIRPDLFTGRFVNVEIETTSPLTLGMTVADWWGVTDRAPNATFLGDVDSDGLFTLLTERLARL